VEDVCDGISVVEQNPATEVTTFSAESFSTALESTILDFIGDGLNVSFIPSRDQHEGFDDAEWSGDIERNDVFTLFGISRRRDELNEVDGFRLSSHLEDVRKVSEGCNRDGKGAETGSQTSNDGGTDGGYSFVFLRSGGFADDAQGF
jgi:hypothetical protein